MSINSRIAQIVQLKTKFLSKNTDSRPMATDEKVNFC